MLSWLQILHGHQKWPSTVIAWLTHGNEPVGKHVIDALAQDLNIRNGQFAGTLYLLEVNQEWHKRSVRSIDTDMNRSFSGEWTGYEATRAREIINYFSDKHIDYVFDFHSTPGDDLPMMICTHTTWSIDISAIFPITHLIVWLPELVPWTSLLEFFHGLWATDIAFEAGQHNKPETLQFGIQLGYTILHNLHWVTLPQEHSGTQKINAPRLTRSPMITPQPQQIIYAKKTITTSSPRFTFAKQYQSFDIIPTWEIRWHDEHRTYSFDKDMVILIPNHSIAKDLQTMKSTWIAHFGALQDNKHA